MSGSSRLLFNGRTETVEAAFPTPRRNRNRNPRGYTLTLEDDEEDVPIEIYTDWRDRIPTYDPNEDNPFIDTPTGTAGPSVSSRRVKTDEEEEMEAASRRGEGMVFVL
jgi:hypothetical protein